MNIVFIRTKTKKLKYIKVMQFSKEYSQGTVFLRKKKQCFGPSL